MTWKATPIADQKSGPRTRSKKSESYVRSTVETPDEVKVASQDDSAPATRRKTEPSKPAATRRRMAIARDAEVELGRGKSAVVTE